VGHVRSALLSNHEQKVDNVLRLAGKLGAQLGILRGNADLDIEKLVLFLNGKEEERQGRTGQVLRWHLRIIMQPKAISGAVAKPTSSAPSRNAMATSRPV